jgi:general secretion pathway protein G
MSDAGRKSLVGKPGSAYQAPPSATSRFSGRGFTLLELVITITILSILTLGAVPLVKISVKRQKEQQLRETLRELRMAIDQFHREAVSAPTTTVTTEGRPIPPPIDPRVRVYVSDQTIFTVDNSDRYPPTLETLVEGVDVLPFATAVMGGAGDPTVKATDVGRGQLTAKKKVYLRAIPVDPLTGKAEWDLRSCYQAVTDTSWDNINVFDVRSKATGTALNGEKYSDW